MRILIDSVLHSNFYDLALELFCNFLELSNKEVKLHNYDSKGLSGGYSYDSTLI